MKHPLQTTALLIFLFVAAQVVGLSLVSLSQDVTVSPTGEREVVARPTVLGERPDAQGGESFLLIAIGVLIGTAIALALIRFGLFRIWRAWFFLAVWVALSIALGVLLPAAIAISAAAVLSAWKAFRPNPIVHNLTEILVYGGIAVLIAPLFDLWWAIALLLAVSVYDWIAVLRTGHMVTLAKAQADRNLFAGLYLPMGKVMTPSRQTIRAPAPPKASKDEGGAAVLGGGDISFPLVLASVAQVWLIEARNLAPATALSASLVVTLGATVALATLFALAKKGRFYPAMPALTAGCLAGLGAIALIL